MSRFNINVKAPPIIGALLKADCTYLNDKISHTRFIASYSHGITLDDSRLYEAGKTIVHIAEILMDRMELSSIEVTIDDDTRRVDGMLVIRDIDLGNIYEDFRKRTKDSHIFAIQVIYEVSSPTASDETVRGKYTVSVVDNGVPIRRVVYELNRFEVMSYDMNFPAPSIFVTEVIEAVTGVL